MNEKTRNVFEQLQEALANIAEQLSSANDALYVVATTAMALNDKLDALSSKLDAITGAATKVVGPVKEIPVVKQPEVPSFSFPKLLKEMK